MKYKVIERKNPLDRDAAPKYYASPIISSRMTVDDFAKQISGRSSLTRGDIKNVLNNFLDELPVFLKLGVSIQLADFGSLRLSLTSEGVDAPEDFSADKIKGARIVFTPSAQLKKAISDITFELNK